LTLDKFMQQIIRSFSKELDFNPQINVESDPEKIFYEVIDQLMQKMENQPELEEIFYGYSLFKTESGNSYRIENELLSVGKELIREKGENYVDKLKSISIDDFLNEIKQARASFSTNTKDLKNNYEKFESLLATNHLQLSDLDQLFKKVQKSVDPD